MAPKERFQEMNMNCKNSRGWLGVGVFLLAALALPACTHRHIHSAGPPPHAGPPAHAPAHGYHRHGIHSARVVGLRITFIAVGGRVIVLADGTYVNQHGHYIVISGGYVHELGGIPPGQIVAASRRRGPRHGYPPGHSKVKFKVKKVKMHGGRLSFVGPDGGTLVFPAGIYKNKRVHQLIVDDGHVRTIVLAANEPSRPATLSTPGTGRPSHADRRPAHANERSTRADERSGRGDEHPSRADRRPTAAQPIEHGACWKTEIRGDVATRKVIPCPDNPKVSATKPAIEKTRPSRSDERPTRADRRPTRADERPTRNTGRSDRSNTSSDRGDARSTNAESSRRPASSAGRASDSSERGAVPAGRSIAQSRKSAAEPSKRGTAQTRKSAAEPSKKRVSGKKDCKESSEQSKSDSSRASSKKKPCKESSK